MRKIILALATMAVFGLSTVAPSSAFVRLGGGPSLAGQFGGDGLRGTVGPGPTGPHATRLELLRPSPLHCHRVCVKTDNHGGTAAPQK